VAINSEKPIPEKFNIMNTPQMDKIDLAMDVLAELAKELQAPYRRRERESQTTKNKTPSKRIFTSTCEETSAASLVCGCELRQ
jgi:hypothetical protein